ncbi:hypothetical protein AHAS_Ahas17G0269300 [Arachis hypogaea]
MFNIKRWGMGTREEHRKRGKWGSILGGRKQGAGSNGKWRLLVTNNSSGADKIYEAEFLVVASGENSEEYIPNIKGLENYQGESMHCSKYLNGREMYKKNVLVVGCGNSGMEIAYDLSTWGAYTSIVVRSQNLLKKFHKGHPKVRTQISIAVAALAVHVPAEDWGDGGIVKWLRDEMDSHPEYIPGFLELLTVLPEVLEAFASWLRLKHGIPGSVLSTHPLVLTALSSLNSEFLSEASVNGCGLEIEPASHKRTSYWFPLLLESSSMIFRFLNALVGFGLFDRGFLVVGSCVEIGIPMLILFIALSQETSLAVSSMELSIKIWDLDVIDAVQPCMVLGGISEKKKGKKVLGLEVCADTIVGNAMLRGISGGQRKLLTTGEVLVGSARALFMDEISTGLDSSTTFSNCELTKASHPLS